MYSLSILGFFYLIVFRTLNYTDKWMAIKYHNGGKCDNYDRWEIKLT